MPDTTPPIGIDGESLSCTIMCGPGSSEVARLALSIYREAGIEWPVRVLTPRHCAADFPWIDSVPSSQLTFDEDVPGRDRIAAFLEAHRARNRLRGRSSGWYLQQYLKLASVWNAANPVFIHDGDTVFSPSLLRRQMSAPFLMTTKEGTLAYNAAARAVGLPTHDKSFVANGGVFVASALLQLASDPADWFVDVMERGVLAADATGDFSEYQIMGALLQQQLPTKQLAIFRRFDLLVPSPSHPDAARRSRQALTRYDAIAFETAHRSSRAKRLVGQCAYWVGHSW